MTLNYIGLLIPPAHQWPGLYLWSLVLIPTLSLCLSVLFFLSNKQFVPRSPKLYIFFNHEQSSGGLPMANQGLADSGLPPISRQLAYGNEPRVTYQYCLKHTFPVLKRDFSRMIRSAENQPDI